MTILIVILEFSCAVIDTSACVNEVYNLTFLNAFQINQINLLELKSFSHLVRQEAPCCHLDQLGSKSAVFGPVPEIWSKVSICLRKAFKGIEEKRAC